MSSNAELSELASQKLQQVHQLVLQFQALEQDLKDTFEEIEKNHQNELKKMQQQLNQAKGIEQSEENTNPMWGQVGLKPNPLAAKQQQQQQNGMASPRQSNNQNNKPQYGQYAQYHNHNNHNNHNNNQQQANNGNAYNQNNNQWNPQTRVPNGSQYNQNNNFHTTLPGQVQPHRNQGHHGKNNTAIAQNYQPQQQRQGWHAKPKSAGNGIPGPPQQNGNAYGYGKKPLPNQTKSLPPSPNKQNGNNMNGSHVNMNNNNNNNNNNNGNGKQKIDILPNPPNNNNSKQRPKNPIAGMVNKFQKEQNNDKLATLDGLGNGISERDFYKKYWIEAGKIGEGAFARVRKITRKSDKAVFALKMIKKKGKSSEDIAALQREILVLQKCDHENIVRLGDWCDTKKRIYMVVEFCDGGDVFERVVQYKKFSEKSAIHVVAQVASGIGHVHSLGYVHRDLKPDNLMYLTKAVDSKIKIIDFGLAGDCNLEPCKTPCGTAHYAAPEVLSSQPYNQSADMWSLGVIVYTLLCGFPPFFDASNNMKNLYHLIKKGQYSFPSPFWDDISENAKDLIRKLLVKDPNGRLNAEQVLQHPWIANQSSANDKDLGNQYVKQMSHWQSTRQATEFGLGQEAPPPPPPDQPINLYYSPEQHQQHQQMAQNDQ